LQVASDLLGVEARRQCRDKARLAEAGFAGDQHDLAIPRLGARPAAHQQVDLLVRGRSVGSEPIRTMPQSGSRRQAVVAPLARFNEAQIGRPEDYRHRGLPDTLGLAVWKGEDHGTSRHRHVHGGRVPTPSYSPQRALSANPQTTLPYLYGPSEPIAGFQLAPFFTGFSMSRKAQV
jgi:hypothetical protein